jgi:hypothetical protein
MSRPLKLKVTGTVLCSVFQLPDHGFIGQFAGAYRRRLFPKRVGWVIVELLPLREAQLSQFAIDRRSLFRARWTSSSDTLYRGRL